MFNAYKKCKVLIKVKDEDSAITVSTEIGTSWVAAINWTQFLKKVYEKYVYFGSTGI